MASNAVAIDGWKHVYSGKVRDLYESTDASLSHLILVVASDRVSAFDHVLEPAIPSKGKFLTELTNWWFDRLEVPNHVSHDVPVPAEEVIAGATGQIDLGGIVTRGSGKKSSVTPPTFADEKETDK